MRIILRIVCLLIGYCFGILQWAYIIGRMRGIDIRTQGSGNSGTTNAMRVMGRNTGLLVLLLDLLKSLTAILLVWALFGRNDPAYSLLYKEYAFAGVVLGHDFPFYMKFKGGKGVAAMAGYVFTFHPSYFPVAVVLFFLPFLTTHYVSLGSICLYTGMLLWMIGQGQLGVYAPMPQAALYEMYVIQAILTVMALYRHKDNIKRLLAGTERKTYLKKA